VFPARSKAGHLAEPKKVWARICESAGVPGLRMHDLRRTHGSLLADAGATTKQVGHSLGHLSPQSTAAYERLTLNPVRALKRRALDESGVADHLRQGELR
ncbi:MAG: tyrosine-type recombinase/integrase, partial [Candidatus Sericytochromatia bacterium]|nr:tyrosine-type recombinase/integrase [Candidatus Sericytochromatia bacterium]